MTNSEIISVKQLFNLYKYQWAICGGWAIDLFLNRQTRPHKDVDILIWRKDQLAMQRYLTERGWTLEIASQGKLSPWAPGYFVHRPRHTIWCKHPAHQPQFIELLMNEQNQSLFQFRRDISIQLPLNKAILYTQDSMPYLAPEIVLLYKANNPSLDVNQQDFVNTIHQLSQEAKAWFRLNCVAFYGKDHVWL